MIMVMIVIILLYINYSILFSTESYFVYIFERMNNTNLDFMKGLYTYCNIVIMFVECKHKHNI
jgi:hypothetical protein